MIRDLMKQKMRSFSHEVFHWKYLPFTRSFIPIIQPLFSLTVSHTNSFYTPCSFSQNLIKIVCIPLVFSRKCFTPIVYIPLIYPLTVVLYKQFVLYISHYFVSHCQKISNYQFVYSYYFFFNSSLMFNEGSYIYSFNSPE